MRVPPSCGRRVSASPRERRRGDHTPARSIGVAQRPREVIDGRSHVGPHRPRGNVETARRRRIRLSSVFCMTPKEIRSRRLALGISVDELARELALPATEVREIEGGERLLTHRALFDQTFARLELAHDRTARLERSVLASFIWGRASHRPRAIGSNDIHETWPVSIRGGRRRTETIDRRVPPARATDRGRTPCGALFETSSCGTSALKRGTQCWTRVVM